MYTVDWNYMPRYPKWIQLVHICLPIVSRDMMISLWSSWYSKWIQWCTIVCRLSPEMWWWIITFLEKVWQLQTMMYAVDWNYIFHCLPLSPEIWWFHFGHHFGKPWCTWVYIAVVICLQNEIILVIMVCHDVRRGLKLYSSIVCRLSPGMWWIITFLESLTGAYHDVHRG